MSDPIVGIDLGTSNSVVAHADGAGPVKVLADDGGYKIHPSVVSFHPNGGVVVGAAAKQRKVIDPHNTIYSVKRLIGRGYRSSEVQTAKTRVPYQIKEGANQLPMIATRGGEFAVPEISAIVLDYVRNIAAARIGTPVQRAVVTVPASFNDAQRSATATAGAIAGLTVVRVLNEPTAAALAYGHTRNLREIIAVYDFGGGTFDITILKLEDQVYEVLGTSGDTFLGGDDLDERLVDKMVAKFLAENRIDLRTNEVSIMRLRAVAEQTKIELSRRSRAVVRIDEIAYGPKGVPLNLQIEISRDEFVSNVSDIIDRTFPVCQEALSVAGLTIDQINDVVLVGGTTKIPYVRDQVSKFFAKAPRADVNPEDAVAVGAALQATSLEKILARPRTSSKIPIQKPPAEEEDTATGSHTDADVLELADEPSGATMAPSELTLTAPPPRPKRTTAGYSEVTRRPTQQTEVAKPDTSYSVTRAGAKEKFEDKTKPSHPNPTFEEATPPPSALPLGRLTKQVPSPQIEGGLAPKPQPQRTMFGVPEGPAIPLPRPDSAVPPPIPSKIPTTRLQPIQRAPGAASSTLDIPTLHPSSTAPGMGTESTTLPTMPAAKQPNPTSWGDEDHQTRPSQPPPSTASGEVTTIPGRHHVPTPPPTPARAPLVPAASPGARTMIADPAAASTAKGFVPPARRDQEFEDESSAQSTVPSTARGFQSPQARTLEELAQPFSQQPSAQQAQPAQPAPLVPMAPLIPQRAPVVLEVTPRGLGIGTVAGYCEELIRRNSRLPAEMKKLFTTSRDRQDLVRIVVCQGESRRLDNNTVIGDLILQNLQPRPRGETSIEVTFTLDASGILQVHARDALTGTEQRATLDLVGGMQQQDVAASRDRIQQLRR